MTSQDSLKRVAAQAALEEVQSGMRLGLGSGSTVAHFVDLLGEHLRDGDIQDVVGVPTSVQTGERARAAGIPLGPLHELAPLDLTVDGADEVDPSLDLIKGLGGALLREKMVASASRRFVVIADGTKRVQRLGTLAPLPVEVAIFAWEVHVPFLKSLGAQPVLRVGSDRSPYVTDNGNYLLDCRFADGLREPRELELRLLRRPGVMETGLFLGMATLAILADEGGVEVIRAPGEAVLKGEG